MGIQEIVPPGAGQALAQNVPGPLTKREAIDQGRQVSRNQGTELRIHNQDGRIAQSDSHGRDPNPPKG